MLASRTVLARHAQTAGLEVRTRHRFGADYAETLAAGSRLQSRMAADQGPGFDVRFKRLWNFYLSYCEAGFRAGATDVMQSGDEASLARNRSRCAILDPLPTRRDGRLTPSPRP